MKHFLRPYECLGAALIAVLAAAVTATPPGAAAQTGMSHISHILQQIDPLLSHSQGYLGVLVTDVDNDSAQKLKLKETRGALITLIDRDAPAGPVLRVNDVVLSVNGENVEGAEQFGRMLREIPAGRKVTLLVSRDGAQQTLTVQLVDRKVMEQDVWNKMNSEDVVPPPPSGMGIFSGGGDGLTGWHMSLFTSSLHVGALVEPLTAQMADYLGVANGVMVKQVAHKSEAATAGLKAHDVILRVGAEPIATTADWDRALRSNEGKSVQITVLRDRKQQTLTLQVDSKHHSQVEWTDIFPTEGCPEMAGLDPQIEFQVDPQLAEQLKAGDFPQIQIDPKVMEELQRQMEQFRQTFMMDNFRIDPKQMEELQRQMEEFRKDFHFDQKQFDDLQRQFKQLEAFHLGQAA